MFSLSDFGLRSIHGKFLIYMLGLTVVPVIIAFAALEWIRYQENYNKLLDKLDTLSASQSLLLAEPLWKNDREQIILNASTLISDPDIIAIQIYSLENTLIYSYGQSNALNKALSRKHSINYVNDNQIKKIGAIELAVTEQNITSDIKQRLYERSLMLSLFLFIVICAYIALQMTVGNALKKLLYSIKQADENNILLPVEWHSDDELGRVVGAYNAMQKRQNQDAIQLRKAHDELEQRVAQRTHLLDQEINIRNHAEQELQTFLNGVPVMLWMLDPDGHSMRFNASWLKFTGLSHAQEAQLNWDGSDIHADFRDTCMSIYRNSIEQKKPFTQEYLKQNCAGHYRWISEVGMPRYDNHQQYLGYFGTCIDITTRKEMEQQLFEEKERAQVTLSSIGEGVITTDENGTIQFLNPVAEKLVGYTQQQALGQALPDIFKILDEKSRIPITNPAKLCVQQGCIISHDNAIVLLSRENQEYFIKDSTAPIFNQQQQIIGTVLVFVDITESIQLSLQLSFQASHDSLTGLVNRREFENRLLHLLNTLADSTTEHALCYMDLDQFKIINDTCGHIAGDELLRQLSSLLEHQLRSRDTLARLGGDEFGVLMEHCPLNQATYVAEKLCQAVQEFRFQWQEKNFTLGISIGLVAVNNSSGGLEQLLIDADSACYAAKNSGRGRVHVYRENDLALAKRHGEMQWTTRINHALDANQFRLYWQPIVACQKNTPAHCELLIRMQGEENQIILPGRFLPAAERYNLAISIDRWVITKALTWIASLPEKQQGIQQFGINLSGHSLSEASFMEFIIEQLQSHQIDTKKICFEITETAAIENLSAAITAIHRLKALGCLFALDDFGTGLSSFAYLKQLPVDYLKIDGFFVKGMDNDPIDFEMVRSINKIGQVMGKKTVAECVENDRSLQHLQDIGVDYVQGNHLGKPRPIEEFNEPFITKQHRQSA